MAQYTPMIQQYLKVKAEAPDAFLFFRLGDFYELFFDDALLAAKELEITLTGRDGGAKEKIPMCGVPYHSAEQYISRLVEKGFKVAICEQTENPAEAKGVVKREIVRIVTPGTIMEGKALDEKSNNYMVSLAESSGEIGLAACDLTTGELHVTSFPASWSSVLDEINVYKPAEIIAKEPLIQQLRSEGAAWFKGTLLSAWEQKNITLVEERFASAYFELAPAGRGAVDVILSYLDVTQKRAMMHLSDLRSYSNQQFLTMDPYSRRNLELVETVMDRSKKGSLYGLLDRTVTSMGSRLLKRWIDRPLLSVDHIRKRQEAVGRLHHELILREELKQCLKNVYDVERLAGRIAYGSANARDLIALRTSLGEVPSLKKECLESGSDTLSMIAETMDDCRDLFDLIGQAVVDDPPISLRDGGLIRDGYHDYLDQLKEAGRSGKQWIAELEQQERKLTGIKSLKIGFNKVFGYYIEVTKSNLSALQEGRYERKQTLANAERYITPELKEKESLILEAQDKMVELEYELFVEIRERLAGQLIRIQLLAGQLAEIDVYQSLADVGAQHRYCCPELSENYDLSIQEGRHPVVESIAKEQQFIANDTSMTRDQDRILLITGPNMAGKSTYMRQVAMICVMAQMGSFVPAKAAKLPIIDHVFTRIGAADDLIGGQSTFMVEMMDIRNMTEKATDRSLVIIDELGRGTSTSEGMSIAQSVIEYLHGKIGCKTLVSTHFHELAALEESLSYLKNYSMAVKESGNQVTFLRKLIEGAADTSYGIYCAQIAGLPEAIIQRSYALLKELEDGSRDPAPGARDFSAVHAQAPLSGEVRDSAVQLSLFEQEAAAAAESKRTRAAASERIQSDDPVDHTSEQTERSETEVAVLQQLDTADLMNMTPLQSMQFIQELKQRLKNQ